MIAISLAPNFELSDAALAVRLLFMPWSWRKGSGVGKVVEKLKKITGGDEIYAVNSGRWGLYLLLKELNLPKESEVLMQAFTCVSVSGPILWNELKPVYVDILEAELTMDPADLERKITPRCRVLIVQHTFGIPARMDEILAFSRKHNLIVIEDCAHVIGGKYRGRTLGTIGDAAIFSFGRDKAVSGVFGGVILVNNKDLYRNLKATMENLPTGKLHWIFQQLMHPIFFQFIVKPLYFTAQIGKIKLVIAQKLGIVSKAISPGEKSGGKPAFPCATLPNALAELTLFQLSRLDKFNARRQEIAEMYQAGFGTMAGLPSLNENGEAYLLRFPLLVDNPKRILLNARSKRMLLGDWYEVVAPKDANLTVLSYKNGSCPVAESVARRIINLPTYHSLKNNNVWKIVEFIKSNL